MAIPGFQELMLPILKLLSDGKEYTSHNIVEELAREFKLTDEEKRELLPSGKQPIFDNRVGWAKTHLKRAELIESPQRGISRITELGKSILAENLIKIDRRFLLERFPEKFPDLLESRERAKEGFDEKKNHLPEIASKQTPEEILEFAYQKMRQELAQELLNQLKNCTPNFFERLVVELLVKMGYGGTIKDAGKAIGKGGDKGIDGIIKEDKLGLDTIYIQAKRWEGTIVGSPEIQKFAGALQGQKAKKGIFITTSDFSKEARDYAKSIENRIVLINGEDLVQLMIDHDIGVSKTESFDLKRLDSDYFAD